MRIASLFRWTFYVLAGLIASLLLIILVLAFVPITIDLSKHKGAVESAAALALGRTVKVDGRIVVVTSHRPHISLEGLRISNPEGFQSGDLLQMKAAKVEVHLLPLLRWKVHIAEVSASGVAVALVEDENGAANWATRPPSESKPEPQAKQPSEESRLELTSDSLVLTKLVLEDISVDYRGPGMAAPDRFKIEKCTGAMLPGKPFVLSLKGKLLKQPYSTEIEIGSLQELVEQNTTWVDIRMEIAETRLKFEGNIDLTRVTNSLRVTAMVEGDRLDSLNGLLDLDLPPLKSYRAGAQLHLQKNRAELSDFVIQVGKSQLLGKMTVDKTGPLPEAVIDLKAPLIQLDDFDVGDWSAESDGKRKGSAAKTEKARTSSRTARPNKLLSPELLEKFNVRMNVAAEKVRAGTDELGGGVLAASLKGGRLSVDPLELKLPAGAFSLKASLKPSRKAPEASVKAVMKNFDFGVLVRQYNPKAEMGGTINLDVDLKSTADSFDRLMANGSGYVDFSGRLENLEAGVIDLWAVNVIAAIAPTDGEEKSKINCVVGRWTMNDGLLTPDLFLVDTTKIRICGKGQVDFKAERIDLKVAPVPKRAEYFNLATPLEVQGGFSDFGVGIEPGGLIGTAVKFIASPLTATLQRLAGMKLPADGSDVCGLGIGHKDRKNNPPVGCRSLFQQD